MLCVIIFTSFIDTTLILHWLSVLITDTVKICILVADISADLIIGTPLHNT